MILLINKIFGISNLKFFLIGFALGGFYYFLYFDDGSKVQARTKASESQLKEIQRELEKFEQILANKKKYGDTLPQLVKSIEHVIQYLPERFTVNQLIDVLTSQLKLAETNVISIQNATKVVYPKNPNIEEISIDVVLRGNYSQILNFLSLLTKLKLIVRVKSMNLLFEKQLKEERSPILRMSSVIIAYRYIGEKKAEEQANKV